MRYCLLLARRQETVPLELLLLLVVVLVFEMMNLCFLPVKAVKLMVELLQSLVAWHFCCWRQESVAPVVKQLQ